MDEKIGFPRLGTMGQLGNQLWQIASSCGVARMNYTQPAFPTDWRYRHVFAVPDEFFDDKARTYPLVHERGEVTSRIDERATIYLQNVSLFDWMERDIRGYFAPRAEIKDTLLVQYPWFYRLDMNKTCALHVRRGDSIGKEYWHPMCTMRYYEKAAEIVRQWEPDVQFVVFSDDIPWCQENFPSDYLMCYRETPTAAPVDVEELLLMTHASYHIIANSTFSWWGAWLSNNKKVINPDIWYGPAYPYLNQAAALLPQSWIQVGCGDPAPDEYHEQNQIRARGWDENIRYYYPGLNENSLVWDVGAYTGEFSRRIHAQYGCRVEAFEILPEMQEHLMLRAGLDTSKVHVNQFGLAGNEGHSRVHDDGASTTTLMKGKTWVSFKKITDVLNEHVDLMKINIEGDEYDLLDELISSGKLDLVDRLQIQFHDRVYTEHKGFVDVPSAQKRYNKIVEALGQTHKQDWCWPWVWESWSRK